MMARRRLERERYWRDVVREQGTSGVSMAAFCRERDLSVTSLYKWRSELKRRAAMDATAASNEPASNEPVRGVATRDGASTNVSVAKFVPIELPPPATAKQAGCEVVLPDGCRIIVSTQCDVSWLREILEVLKDRAC